MNNSNSFCLSSQERCFSPLLIFMAFFWTCSNRSKGYFSPAFSQNHVSMFWVSTSETVLGKNWSRLKTSGLVHSDLVVCMSPPALSMAELSQRGLNTIQTALQASLQQLYSQVSWGIPTVITGTSQGCNMRLSLKWSGEYYNLWDILASFI